jgi:hypothetical protein
MSVTRLSTFYVLPKKKKTARSHTSNILFFFDFEKNSQSLPRNVSSDFLHLKYLANNKQIMKYTGTCNIETVHNTV